MRAGDRRERGSDAFYKCDGGNLAGMAAQYATADQVESMQPNLVAVLGDEQYQTGRLSDFENSFDKSYGAFKFLQRRRRATTSTTATPRARAAM